MKVGLRIDVDTFRGTKYGVPALCNILSEYQIKATFFFSVGPDNMGRHLWRLLKPQFLLKMLRSNAASLYGWDILFKGTFWPGPIIGLKLQHIITDAANSGHEIGLHAWDHHAWQANIDKMTDKQIYLSLSKGFNLLGQITGKSPICSAVPGWKCNDKTLIEKNKFPFKYNSDCRGNSLFHPVVSDHASLQTQVPVTLPTYDEIIGKNGITDNNYNDYIFSLIKPAGLNVLTIHAEVEGIAKFDLFKDFLIKAISKNISFVPLGDFLDNTTQIPASPIIPEIFPGREGWISCQS
jgi:undecaprenyl phosphate-alpha-L-ara4FN deformylase